MDVKDWCSEFLPALRSDAVDTLRRLDFYLRTLEEFIDKERSQEIAALKSRHAARLPPQQQGAFWAWHYPAHWDDIFASQLRSSFVVTLISLAESHTGMVVEQACEVAGIPCRPNDFRGFERRQKCLSELSGFKRPVDSAWVAICEIRDVRNCIVHANSRIYASKKKKKRLRCLASKLPGLAGHDMLELSTEFPVYALQTVEDFVLMLYKEGAERLSTRIETSPS